MKNIISIIYLMMFSSTSFSQNLKFADEPKQVVQKSATGKAFEVSQQNIDVAIYKYELIDNPEYTSRIKKIDSLQQLVNELQKKNFGGELKNAIGISSKKNKKEIEIEELKQQISVLEKDIPPRKGYSTYNYTIPKQIKAYITVGERDRNREILIIDSTKNVFDQLEGDLFTEELTMYGGGNLYRLLNKDTLFFKKNELLIEDSIRKYFGRDGIEKLSVEIGYLFKRENDNAIFLFDETFKKDMVGKKQYEFSKLLDDLGISVETSEEHSNLVLVKNGRKCVLTSDVREYLESKKNADIIDKINNSLTQYRNYLNQKCDITFRMAKYIQAYNPYVKITTNRRAEWERDTRAAIVIEEKMRKLPFHDSMPYQANSKENQLHSANIDIILYSRRILGI